MLNVVIIIGKWGQAPQIFVQAFTTIKPIYSNNERKNSSILLMNSLQISDQSQTPFTPVSKLFFKINLVADRDWEMTNIIKPIDFL